MQAKYIKLTAIGVSPLYIPDTFINPFSIALGVAVSGTGTYTVEYTFDDVFAAGFNPATAHWFAHPSMTAQTGNKDSNIAYPVTGIRLNVAAVAGSVTLAIIQAGP